MKKTILSMIITICLAISSFSIVFADDYDYYNTTYGTYSYYHATQINSTAQPDFNEVGVSIGGLNVPIPNNTGAVSFIYQFNKCYSGSLTITFNASVDGYYKLIYGDYGAKINYTSGTTLNVSVYECTRLEIVLIGTGSATKVNSVNHTLTEVAANTQIDYSNQLSNIYQVLGYINTTVHNIDSNTDNIEGFIDGIEGYIDGVENTLSNINTNLSNISTAISTSNSNTSNINTNVINIYNLLNNLQTYFGNELAQIVSNTDQLESTLNTINSSINNIQSLQFQVADIQMPYYQYLFFSMLTRSNMSLIRYDESNVPYVQWGDIKDLNLLVQANGYLTLAYYVNNSSYNHILLNGSAGVVINGINTNTRYGVLSRYNITGNQSITFLNENTQVAPPDSTRIYPLYMGYDHIPEEIALLFPGVESSSSINKNVQTVQNLLTNILNYLINLELENDDSELISAIDTLTLAISQMNQDITVTNNVSVNSHDLPFYQYLFLSMLIRNNYSVVNFDESGAPYVLWGDIKNNTFTFNAGTGTNKVLISYLCTDANFTMKINNQNITRYRGFGTSSKYNSYYYGDYSFGNQTVTFSTTSNNGVITDTTRIYPVYMGLYDYVPENISSILGIYPANTDYSDVLDDILDSLNNLDLNISYNVSNEQIYDITNDFDTNIEIVNNVEVDFNTSFESSNNNITSSDLTINLQPYSESISLYHDLFSTIYNLPLFKYVVIICMVGGVVLVLLG